MLAAVISLMFLRSFLLVSIVIGLIGVGIGLGIPPFVVLAAERFGTEVAATVIAAINTAGQLSSALAGIVYGYIFDQTGSFTMVWMLAAGLLALRLGMVAIMVEDHPQQEMGLGRGLYRLQSRRQPRRLSQPLRRRRHLAGC
jgi:sugar phosphate permease